MRATEFVTEVKGHDYMAGHCHVMAVALKQLHPDWKIRAHTGWDEDAEDDSDYRVDHVYTVAPDGTAYDCRGKFSSEEELVGPDETGGVDTQFVDYGIDDIKHDIARGELKRFSKEDLVQAVKFIQSKQGVAEGLSEGFSNAVTFFRGEPILSQERLNQLKSSIGKPYPLLRKEGSAANIGTYMSPDGDKATSFVKQALAGQGKGGVVTQIQVNPNSFSKGDGGIDEAVIITNIAGLVSNQTPNKNDPLRIQDRKQAMLKYLGPGVKKYLNDPLLSDPKIVQSWYNPEFAQKNWNTINSGKQAVTKPGESNIQERMMRVLGPLAENIRRDPEVISYFISHNPGDWVEYNFRMNSDGSGTKVVDVKYYPPAKQGVAEGKQPGQAVVDAILRVMPVAQEIWFHGSRATGKHRRNSDTDILVVVPDDLVGDQYLGAVRILQKLSSHFDNYDIQPTKAGTNIHRTAQEEGRLLWSKQAVAEAPLTEIERMSGHDYTGGKKSLRIGAGDKNIQKLPGTNAFVYSTEANHMEDGIIIKLWDSSGSTPKPVQMRGEDGEEFAWRLRDWERNQSEDGPGTLIGKLVLEDVPRFPLKGALQVDTITVDEDYRGQGVAKSLYGIALSILRRPLVAGRSQTPGGRRNWLSLASTPGVEVKGYLGLNEVWLKNSESNIDTIMGRLGGQYIGQSRPPGIRYFAFDVVAGSGELAPAVKTSLSQIYGHTMGNLGLYATWSGAVTENFADGRHPEDKGDSQRHGIPKGATQAELEKASHAKGRKGQLARWQLNMRRGHKK